MLKPNSLTSLRNPSSSSSSSSYFFQNLIQPNLAIVGNRDDKTLNPGVHINPNDVKGNQYSMRKSRRVQQLAEEVAGLLIDEKGLMQKVETGNFIPDKYAFVNCK